MKNRIHVALLGLTIATSVLLVEARGAHAGLCPSLCGSNSATVGDGIVFDELNLKGEARPGGPRIRSVRLASTDEPATLVVRGDRLSASAGTKTFDEQALTNIVILLEMKDGRQYELKLASYNDSMHFWADPDGITPAYDFLVRKARQKRGAPVFPPGMKDKYVLGDRPVETDFDPEAHLCGGTYVEETVKQRADQRFTAVVFEGDHYNRNHTVSASAPGSFNLACFGTASAKMHLLRHTQAGTALNSRPTSLDQRTTMLRAITADYCGDGRSWTADGTPLWWTDQNQRFPLGFQPAFADPLPDFSARVEAVWGGQGRLLCLNEPRRKSTSTSDKCTHPAVARDDVVKGPLACHGGGRIPRCSAFPWPKAVTNPWADTPLRPSGGEPKAKLPGAYVVTVNRTNGGDYCGKVRSPP
jgi:hypothetical protein